MTPTPPCLRRAPSPAVADLVLVRLCKIIVTTVIAFLVAAHGACGDHVDDVITAEMKKAGFPGSRWQ